MIATVLFALMLATSGGVEVQGTSRCPTPAEVAALLPELLPSESGAPAAKVWIETAGLDLEVTMRSESGEVLFSRRLTSHGTCADLATVAAVVIASWTAERNTAISLEQPGVPAGVAPAPVAPLSPAQAAPPPPEAGSSTRDFDLGVGLGSTANSAGWVGAVRLEGGMRAGLWGLRMGLLAETARDQTLATGSVSWRRYALSAGPTLNFAGRRLLFESRAELFAGLTTVAGHGFPTNRQSRAVAPGLTLVARLATRLGRFRPWIEAGGQLWLAEQEISVTKAQSPSAFLPLPRVEARMLAGLSFSLSP